jgi:DNA repair protein RadA/Sms
VVGNQSQHRSEHARREASFICQNCGAAYGRWQGKCDACGEWNTIAEESSTTAQPQMPGRARAKAGCSRSSRCAQPATPRLATGPASSTASPAADSCAVRSCFSAVIRDRQVDAAIQVAAALARRHQRVAHISGEEAVAQVRLRAERSVTGADVGLAAETSIEDIVATLGERETPRLVIIDRSRPCGPTCQSAPGTVTQVRERAGAHPFALPGAAVILVGHVTKDGQIAGPRVVEHMVDAVLSFEGEGSHQFRILRAVKNRFGPTDEIGVFEMTGGGLREIANPSELFLSERDLGSPGTAVFAGIEGSRPLLVEIQALVAPTSLGTPRRAVNGWDPNRLSMVLAVLEAHCRVRLSGHDVYLNVAGGLRIQEPAADLAAAAALVSSLADAPLPADAVYFGEISLSGAIRPVAQAAARLKEAQKLVRPRRPSRGGAKG